MRCPPAPPIASGAYFGNAPLCYFKRDVTMKIIRFAIFLLPLLLAACGQESGTPTSTPIAVSSTPMSTTSTQQENAPTGASASPTGDDTATAMVLANMAAAEKLVALLAQEDFAKAEQNFNDVMKQQLPPDKLSTTWKGLIAQDGPFKQQT